MSLDDHDSDGLPATLFGLPIVVDDKARPTPPLKLGQYRNRWPFMVIRREDGMLEARVPKNANFIDTGEPPDWGD